MSESLKKGLKLHEFCEYFSKELKKIMDSRPDITRSDLGDRLRGVFGMNANSTKNIISRYRSGRIRDGWVKRVPYLLQVYDVKPNAEIVLKSKEQFPDFIYPPKIKEKYLSIYEKIKLLTDEQKKTLEEIGKIEDLSADLKNDLEETVDFWLKKNKKKKK